MGRIPPPPFFCPRPAAGEGAGRHGVERRRPSEGRRREGLLPAGGLSADLSRTPLLMRMHALGVRAPLPHHFPAPPAANGADRRPSGHDHSPGGGAAQRNRPGRPRAAKTQRPIQAKATQANPTQVFGPVLAVMPFSTEEEAIALANDSDYGLGAAVISADAGRCERMAGAFRAGIVWVNCSQPCFCHSPWGGVKRSGRVARRSGRAGGGVASVPQPWQLPRLPCRHRCGTDRIRFRPRILGRRFGRELGPFGFENFLNIKQAGWGGAGPFPNQGFLQPAWPLSHLLRRLGCRPLSTPRLCGLRR